MEVELYLSDKPHKKYVVKFPDGKKIYFGAPKYEDYTIHKNNKRKQNYIKRHAKNEDWTNKKTAGFWSRWLLWEKPNLGDAIKNIEKEFNLKIKI